MDRPQPRYRPGATVAWRTPFGEWFVGVVQHDRKGIVTVNRIVPMFAAGVPLVKIMDDYGQPALAPAPMNGGAR